MAAISTKILVNGIARGEIQGMLRRLKSLKDIWNNRYNIAGVVLFSADQVTQLEEMITMLEGQLSRTLGD